MWVFTSETFVKECGYEPGGSFHKNYLICFHTDYFSFYAWIGCVYGFGICDMDRWAQALAALTKACRYNNCPLSNRSTLFAVYFPSGNYVKSPRRFLGNVRKLHNTEAGFLVPPTPSPASVTPSNVFGSQPLQRYITKSLNTNLMKNLIFEKPCRRIFVKKTCLTWRFDVNQSLTVVFFVRCILREQKKIFFCWIRYYEHIIIGNGSIRTKEW